MGGFGGALLLRVCIDFWVTGLILVFRGVLWSLTFVCYLCLVIFQYFGIFLLLLLIEFCLVCLCGFGFGVGGFFGFSRVWVVFSGLRF